MYGLCRVLCIVCIVFLFPLLFMYSSRLRTNAACVERACKQKKVAFAPPRGCNFLFRVVGVLPSPRFSAFELDASVFALFAFVLLQVCSANYEIRSVQKK